MIAPKVAVLFVGFILIHQTYSMSESQLKSTLKLIRSMCQPKFKVTNAEIEGMHNGNFPDVKKLKCYSSCTLHSLKFMKDGKINYDFAIGESEKLPEARKKPTKESIISCKDAITSEDKCDGAYQLSTCIYKSNPANYFLP